MYFNEKHKENVEKRGYGYIGSYLKSEITIDGKNINKKQYYIRVICSYCNQEYDVMYTGFNRGENCNNCCQSYDKSIAHYIEVELNEHLNDYWDNEKNIKNPRYIYKNTHDKFWIRCTNKYYHESYEIKGYDFTKGSRCPYCAKRKVHPKDSFAQWCINNIDENFLEKYWSNKNTSDPWKLAPGSNKRVWIKCQDKDYHGDYLVMCSNFKLGTRCPYCNIFASKKVHYLDSFGYKYPELSIKWNNELNKITPFEISPMSGKKVWFNCLDCGVPTLKRVYNLLNGKSSIRCDKCGHKSKGEEKIIEIFDKYKLIHDKDYVCQKKFYGLVGVNKGNLSYDFYLSGLNLLIEFQGIQHEKFVEGLHSSIEDFKIQLEHDKRKREYASNHDIKLLEIWHYEFNDIEKILCKEINN